MQMHNQAHTTPLSGASEYVTIVAPTLAEVMQKFRDTDLASQGYAIAGQAVRHRFSFAGSDAAGEMFDGNPMIAATFFRSASGR